MENLPIRFKESSLMMRSGEVWANRKQLEEFYNVPKRTLADNINKLKEDGLVIGRNIAQSSTVGRAYDTEIYNFDEIVAIGFRLRSDKAIEVQRWGVSSLRNEYDRAVEESKEKDRKLDMQQAQLDFFWDKEDQKDNYR